MCVYKNVYPIIGRVKPKEVYYAVKCIIEKNEK